MVSRTKDIAKDSGKAVLVKVHEVESENLEIYFNLPKWQVTLLEKKDEIH